jgi:ParB family chromosome partitioning protein
MSDALENIVELPISVLERGFFQPREYFNAEAMEATRKSIQEKGQKYPVIVRAILPGNPLYDPSWTETHYELADGERRFRCCRDLGFSHLKALIRELTDEEMLDYTVTTNDSLPLNPIEKAVVFSRLATEFGKSQAEIAKSFNLKQQQVSEYIRLLELPKEIQDLTARAVISVRHARELLKIQDKEKMAEMALAISQSALSTRELTKLVKKEKKSPENGKKEAGTSENQERNVLLGEYSGGTAQEDARMAVQPLSQLEFGTHASKLESFNQERAGAQARTWVEHLHRIVIPKASYEKMEYWLAFELGSRRTPEAWLMRVELALLVGVLVSIGAWWLPERLLLSGIGVVTAVLAYVFLA